MTNIPNVTDKINASCLYGVTDGPRSTDEARTITAEQVRLSDDSHRQHSVAELSRQIIATCGEKIASYIPIAEGVVNVPVMSEVPSDYEDPKLEGPTSEKSSMRKRADAIKPFICKHLIAVLECPTDLVNLASVIRNVNALGVEKVYVVDPGHHLPDDWEELRDRKKLSKLSVSASKWSFVKRFNSTDECFDYLESKNFESIVTSPHIKGKLSINLHEGDFTKAAKLAVWFGTEGAGISDRAVERSTMCVAIPMFGMIDSMNLGTSSGIILYEITKQRREYQSKYRKRDQRGERETPLPTVIGE